MLWDPSTQSATVAAIVDIPRYNIQTVDIYAWSPHWHCHCWGIFVVIVDIHKYNIQAVDIFAWSPHCIVGMLGELERRENINIPLPIGSQREYY